MGRRPPCAISGVCWRRPLTGTRRNRRQKGQRPGSTAGNGAAPDAPSFPDRTGRYATSGRIGSTPTRVPVPSPTQIPMREKLCFVRLAGDPWSRLPVFPRQPSPRPAQRARDARLPIAGTIAGPPAGEPQVEYSLARFYCQVYVHNQSRWAVSSLRRGARPAGRRRRPGGEKRGGRGSSGGALHGTGREENHDAVSVRGPVRLSLGISRGGRLQFAGGSVLCDGCPTDGRG